MNNLDPKQNILTNLVFCFNSAVNLKRDILLGRNVKDAHSHKTKVKIYSIQYIV